MADYFEQCAAAGQPHITAGANVYKIPSTQLLRGSDQCSKFACVHAIIFHCLIFVIRYLYWKLSASSCTCVHME